MFLNRLYDRAGLNRDQKMLAAAVFLAGFGDLVWLHLQTLYIQSLGADARQIGGVLGVASLVVIFIYVPAGILADRWRRKPIMLGGWTTSIVAMALLIIAPDWRWAAPALAIYFFSSFSRPALSGYIAASAKNGDAGKAFAFIFSHYALGGILAPAVGGFIAAHLGLRAVFATAAVFYLLSLSILIHLTDIRTPTNVRGLQLKRLVSNGAFVWQIVVFICIVFALDIGTTLAPNYLQQVKGLAVQSIGALGTAASIGMAVITLLLGLLPAQRRTGLLLDQLIVALSLVLLLIAPPATTGAVAPILFVAYFLRGGVNAVFSVMSGRLSFWLQPDVLSLGFGFRDMAVRIALTVSPWVAGQLYAIDPSYPLLAGLAALAASMLITLTLPRRAQPIGNAATAPLATTPTP